MGELNVNSRLISGKQVFEKRHLEVELHKCWKIEPEVNQLHKLPKTKIKKVIATLSSASDRKGMGASSKSWDGYSWQHENRRCKKIMKDIRTAFEGEHFTPVTI